MNHRRRPPFRSIVAGVTLCVALSGGISCGAVQDNASVVIPDNALILTNGTVITGTGADPIPDGTVVIGGDRILAVGPATDFRIPQGAQVIDAGGGTILPGIINSHVHHGGPAEERRRFLEEGVTTVCDLGSPFDEIAGFEEERSPDGPVARGFFAGPIVTAPGGYPDGLYGTTGFNYEVSDPQEGREAVRDLLARGASFIKIALDPSWNFQDPLPMLSVEHATAIVEEAHIHGILVRSHQIQITYFPMAVEAGLDVIEHMPFPTGWPSPEEIQGYMELEDPLSPFFEDHFPQYGPLLEGMAAGGITMVPTVSALLSSLYGRTDLSQRDQYVVDAILDIIRRYRDVGGVVALGNDFNGRSVRERLPLIEMKALVDAGLTPMEVIEASTHNAAFVCGQDEDLGTLEAGKLADVIVVEGNPLTDIEAVGRVTLVLLGGEVAYEPAR